MSTRHRIMAKNDFINVQQDAAVKVRIAPRRRSSCRPPRNFRYKNIDEISTRFAIRLKDTPAPLPVDEATYRYRSRYVCAACAVDNAHQDLAEIGPDCRLQHSKVLPIRTATIDNLYAAECRDLTSKIAGDCSGPFQLQEIF